MLGGMAHRPFLSDKRFRSQSVRNTFKQFGSVDVGIRTRYRVNESVQVIVGEFVDRDSIDGLIDVLRSQPSIQRAKLEAKR